VHDEVLNLRDLMQQMKPHDLSPKQLLDYLADLVDRFRRDTGISTRFVSELQDVPLRQMARRELARIAQEALVNARKHSGARNVLVKLELRDGVCCLVVDDDGRGYDFAGRFTKDELDLARKGPVVIKERVHAIGGDLTLESIPGRGTRLEVTVPLRV
jgi:signal transduction histidine kinase